MPIHDWGRGYSGLFHDFHQTWSVQIKLALNSGILPKGYKAYVEMKSGKVAPDVLAVERRGGAGTMGGNGVAALPATHVARKPAAEGYAERANRIVVHHPYGSIVSAIEIVSPGNKSGKDAFAKFVRKSRGFLARGVHLLVVDLFPPTRRDPQGVHPSIWKAFAADDFAYTLPPGKDRTAVSYKADVAEEEWAAYVEPLALGDAIPDMPLFLAPDFGVKVPLEATYQAIWDGMDDEQRQLILNGRPPGVEDA